MPHKEVIKDMREGCDCEKHSYCPLEVLIIAHQDGDRLFSQHKIVEMFKWEESKREGCDVGWEESYKRYVARGWAKAFAEIYEEGMKHKEIYAKILLKLKENKNG